ncbi:adenylyltransferase/cytidyltransferase family protein [Roseateles cellulosilyticus]|uniref:Adenylyltransferase/cytidyltransferase family protein n=1 Tax=Pelomonas cellulosilytica TaxID=2906762 RepID=A0ABS8XV39_9BURK|nr:adenylyltransferase/cytidyltransferase family protein [Pelomonas sp. P8]MCE4553140.1 adenylyltransferase/cytidyltransferase family protein [Pelomonas sp. P8]
MEPAWDSTVECLDPERLIERVPWLERPLVVTNGVFDVLHAGHVSCLEAARREGGTLVVALNSDVSARNLGKPGERPFNALDQRARVVAALGCVSWVTWFDERTPAELLDALQPDIYVKGGDYSADTLPEAAQVRSWGGRVVIVPHLDGHSSTRLNEQMRDAA